MSRSYRIRVRDSLRRIVRAEDHVGTQLELLPILPPETMGQLLAEQLVARGFERDGQVLRREQEGVAVTVDLADGTVTVGLSEEENLQLERSCEGRVYGETRGAVEAARERLEEEVQSRLEGEAEDHQRRLQQQVTDRLERELAGVQAELDQAANRATAEALKRKAAQLGRVKQISDDPQSGALTIVVEV